MTNHLTVAALSMTLLLASSAGAGTPAHKCRAALKHESQNPYPTAAERQAEADAVKNAFTICRSTSVPADLRAESARRWGTILSQRDIAAAEALYRGVIREIEKEEGPDSPALLPVLNGLMDVVVQVSGGPTGEALELATSIRRIAEKAHGPDSEPAAKALLALGRLHELNGSRSTAEELYRDAIDAAAASCGPKCGTLAAGYSMLRDLIKSDPARSAEADDLETRAMESLPDKPAR